MASTMPGGGGGGGGGGATANGGGNTTGASHSQGTTARNGVKQLSESFCAPQYAASLKCLDDSDYDKSKCQDHFEAYKACRKQEVELEHLSFVMKTHRDFS